MDKRRRDIPFNKPFLVGKELHYISMAVHAGHLSGNGPFTKRCHSWLEKRLGCQKALLTHSCTAALEMAAILCDIEPGDEVILPSFTFVSTANAFALRGARLVFVDIKPDTLNIDETAIEAAITPKTKVILPVHYAGSPCAMDEIMDIAARNDLLVVEDAAQSMLTTYRDKPLGALGHLGCLSFHETKNVISGEGGALLVNDARFIERAEIIWEKGTDRSRFFRGQVDKYTWQDIGSSFLPSELVGAFLYAQFEHAETICAARLRSFSRYLRNLESLEEKGLCRLPAVQDRCGLNGHIFYLIARSREERARLIDFLRERGVGAHFHYVPLHSSPAGLRFGRASGALEVTERISETLVRLPLFYEITAEEVDYVSEAVTDFYARSRSAS